MDRNQRVRLHALLHVPTSGILDNCSMSSRPSLRRAAARPRREGPTSRWPHELTNFQGLDEEIDGGRTQCQENAPAHTSLFQVMENLSCSDSQELTGLHRLLLNGSRISLHPEPRSGTMPPPPPRTHQHNNTHEYTQHQVRQEMDTRQHPRSTAPSFQGVSRPWSQVTPVSRAQGRSQETSCTHVSLHRTWSAWWSTASLKKRGPSIPLV